MFPQVPHRYNFDLSCRSQTFSISHFLKIYLSTVLILQCMSSNGRGSILLGMVYKANIYQETPKQVQKNATDLYGRH